MISVADPVPFLIPDPQHIESLVTIFWGKKTKKFCQLAQFFVPYRYLFNNKKNFSLGILLLQKKGQKTNYFSPLLFCCCCYWTRDPISGIDKNQDPGSGINISDTRVRNNAYHQDDFWRKLIL
jgi:hypothetical protein